MSKLRATAKSIVKRTGRAFGFSEVRDDLAMMDRKINDLSASQCYYRETTTPLLRFYYYNEAARKIHSSLFEKYRGIYKGKDVVLVACGPSLDYYKPIPGAIHVAVNRAFLVKDIKFDYIFMHDSIMYKKYKKDLREYDAEKFVAFATSEYNAKAFNMTTAQVDYINARRFMISDVSIVNTPGGQFDVINPDITQGVFYDRGGGTVFSALQFILFTKPKHIFLVGCDCTEDGYFSGVQKTKQHLLAGTEQLWKESRSFVRQYCPETSICSINPVRLRGSFEDYYTESYIEANKLTDIKQSRILR